MSTNGRDHDDAITPMMAPVANPNNREIITQIANLVVEASAHRSAIMEIYRAVCEMTGIAPKQITVRLADEEERHIERAQINLALLRAT